MGYCRHMHVLASKHVLAFYLNALVNKDVVCTLGVQKVAALQPTKSLGRGLACVHRCCYRCCRPQQSAACLHRSVDSPRLSRCPQAGHTLSPPPTGQGSACFQGIPVPAMLQQSRRASGSSLLSTLSLAVVSAPLRMRCPSVTSSSPRHGKPRAE